MKRWLSFFTLFTSLGTIVCCVLPALFVALGFGAAFAGLVGTFPQLIWFSEHKTLVFGSAFSFLLVAGYQQWVQRNAPCPTDPKLAAACMSTRRWSFRLYVLSLALFSLGFMFAFILPLFS